MTSLIDHNRYNDLALLEASQSSRQDVDKVINGPIRDVFIKHGAQRAFCLYLQHRHHQLIANEAIVKVEGSAHVMDDNVIKDICSMGNMVVPTTWMTSGGEFVPMEFAVVAARAANDTASAIEPGFLSDLLSVLVAHDCSSLFGIDMLAQHAWSEMSIGNASVVVPSYNDNHCHQDKFVPVAFAFKEDQPKFQVHGRCKVSHKHTSKPRPKPDPKPDPKPKPKPKK